MKTTLTMRNTANPRRITLVQLQDADDELTAWTELAVEPAELGGVDGLSAEGPPELTAPEQTANPQRTVLMMLEDAPA